MESPPVCQRFSAADSDVTIKSSDGVLFKVHRRNLEFHCESFPGEEIATNDEIVQLTETSEILELLFQYMYRQRQPDLTGLTSRQLCALAEAAEKYRVYAAMDMCNLHMKLIIDTNPLGVLAYATRHDYKDICDAVAPKTISLPVAEVLQALTLDAFKDWILYRERWIILLRGARSFGRPGRHWVAAEEDYCPSWDNFWLHIRDALSVDPQVLKNPDKTLKMNSRYLRGCPACTKHAEIWVKQVQASVAGLGGFAK